MSERSLLEAILLNRLQLAELPAPVRELRFAPPRRWRADFAWPDYGLLVEVDGGTWSHGRHNRSGGYRADCAKINTAQLMGWRVLRFTGAMVTDPGPEGAVETIRAALGLAGAPLDEIAGGSWWRTWLGYSLPNTSSASTNRGPSQ